MKHTKESEGHTNHVSLFLSQHSTEGFWKSVARYVPRDPSDMRILNPHFIQEASFKLIGLPHNNGQMGRGVRDLLFPQQEQRDCSCCSVSLYYEASVNTLQILHPENSLKTNSVTITLINSTMFQTLHLLHLHTVTIQCK